MRWWKCRHPKYSEGSAQEYFTLSPDSAAEQFAQDFDRVHEYAYSTGNGATVEVWNDEGDTFFWHVKGEPVQSMEFTTIMRGAFHHDS